jgi:hypothetical protein
LAALTPARWSAAVVATAAAGGGVALGRAARLTVLLFADTGVAPGAVHYDVRVDGANVTVLAPYRVRPGALLSLAFMPP